MTGTEEYITRLRELQSGSLGLLRTHAGQGLDETVAGFDLFAGLWWPLREKNHRAPRREVAWLVAKLYAACPLKHASGAQLARQLRRCSSNKDPSQWKRIQQKFDELLLAPLPQLEPLLRWALMEIQDQNATLDWVRLTDDLSIWERESTRHKWAEQYLSLNLRSEEC